MIPLGDARTLQPPGSRCRIARSLPYEPQYWYGEIVEVNGVVVSEKIIVGMRAHRRISSPPIDIRHCIVILCGCARSRNSI